MSSSPVHSQGIQTSLVSVTNVMSGSAATPSSQPATPASQPTMDAFGHLSDAIVFIHEKSAAMADTSMTIYRDMLRDHLAAYVLASKDTSISEDNLHRFCQIAGIAKYDEVMVTLKALESKHRIFSAADMRYATNRPSTVSVGTPVTSLHFDAAIQFLDRSDLKVPLQVVHRSYGDNVEDDVRPLALKLFFSACAHMATIWGFYQADEEPTVESFSIAMSDYADNHTPFDPALQISPMFSRRGAVEGWNIAATCIDDEMEIRAAQFAENKCTVQQIRAHFVTAMRNAFSQTATVFAARVDNWTWTALLGFDQADESYTRAFKEFLSSTGICDGSADAHNFSLVEHTDNVRMLRETNPGSEATTATRLTSCTSVRPSKMRRVDGSFDQRPQDQQPASQHNSLTHTQRAEQERRRQQNAIARAEVLRAEQDRARRRMARRERNRERNRELSSTALKERHMHDLRQLRHQLYGDAEEFYELDDPDSDNEDLGNETDIYVNAEKDVNTIAAMNERVDLEVLYEEILSHCVDPKIEDVPKSLLSIIEDHGKDNNTWLRRFIPRNLSMFLLESTRAADALHYADHQKVLIHIETHFQLVTALFEAFPQMLITRNPWPIVDQLEGTGRNAPHRNRFVLSVDQKNDTRLLSNLVCHSYSADHNVRRSLVNSFPGMTLCVGYFKRPLRSEAVSPLMLFLCRYITNESDSIAHNNMDGEQLDAVKVHLVCSRYWSATWNIAHGDVITLIPFSSFVSVTRQMRAAHEVHKLPQPIQRVLFGIPGGNHNGPLPYRPLPRSRHEYEQSLRPIDEIRVKVDAESLDYLDSIPSNLCDESQKRAICTSLAEMGSLAPSSTSVSAIFGPPGTGKSTSICHAIGALLYHSTAGHVNGTRRPLLKHSPNLIFSNDDGIRILVTCPSNQGVDEIAAKLKGGIRAKNGSLIFPKIVRIGRFNYEYGDLDDVSVRHLGLQYDAQVFHVDEHPLRKTPSKQAQHALAEEAVVFLCTTSTAAGPMLKNLRASFSVIFIDEAAHGSEQDTLCALAAGSRFSQLKRFHVVLVGDSNQLKPVYICQHPATTFVSKFKNVFFRINDVPISMQRQFVSLFERLYDRRRCVFSWLTHQYRSHPQMARITMAPMYGDILVQPTDVSAYLRPFNQIPGANGLLPLTIVDTRLSLRRRESKRGAAQGLHNELEVEIVNNILFDIIENSGNTYLGSDIIVTAPYRAQIGLLKEHLAAPNSFVSQHQGLNLKVDTIDALQGSERSVVVMSLTRSGGQIGFLKENNRLNVACTRAKHLMVVVGDFSTMFQSRYMSSLYNSVLSRLPGTLLRMYHPPPQELDDRELRWAEENVDGFGL